MSPTFSVDALAELLSTGYKRNSTVAVPATLEPDNINSAYAVQQRLLTNCEFTIGGWKIGSKSETGPIQGAPLPLPHLYPCYAAVARGDYPVLGLELELIFSFKHDFAPQREAVPEQDIMDSIASFGASIEIVSSRIAGWPNVPKLSQLADLQNNGALIVGAMVDYHSDFPFSDPLVDFRMGEITLFAGPGRNPAGDPRRLLCWLVNHCREKGLMLPAGSIVTTGSYSGMAFPVHGGTVKGSIAGLPTVTFELI